VIKLLLFDIDGTLIRTGGAGVRAFERTFAEMFGLPEAVKKLQFSGRTDRSLVREAFTLHQIEPTEANFRHFFDHYPRFLTEFLAALPGALCDGVDPFLRELLVLPNRPALGLLTGNTRVGAELKLRKFGLWDKFAMGGFAEDHEDRNGIAAAARDRGEQLLGQKLAGEEIVVIGDTPHDVTCAHSIGAHALAVATGIHSVDELRALKPRWAVPRLDHLTLGEVLAPAK